MVQWLRVCPSTAEGAGLIPGGGTRIPHAGICSQQQQQRKRKERESTREKLKGNRAGSSLWLVSLAPMSSESESGALRSQKPPLGPSWCPAGPETEGPAHSEDRERAEAREPRALTDCLPGHSPDRASCKTVSTNPEQSEGATWSLALRRHSRPVIPPLLLPFLQSSWSSNSLQALLLPTQPTVVIIRVTAPPPPPPVHGHFLKWRSQQLGSQQPRGHRFRGNS